VVATGAIVVVAAIEAVVVVALGATVVVVVVVGAAFGAVVVVVGAATVVVVGRIVVVVGAAGKVSGFNARSNTFTSTDIAGICATTFNAIAFSPALASERFANVRVRAACALPKQLLRLLQSTRTLPRNSLPVSTVKSTHAVFEVWK